MSELSTELRERALWLENNYPAHATVDLLRRAADEIERLEKWRHDTETAMLAFGENACRERRRAEKAEAEVERLKTES